MQQKLNDRASTFEKAVSAILSGDKAAAKETIRTEYPFQYIEKKKRNYSIEKKMKQFFKDGFIDRYSGERLVNPGILKVLSCYFPVEFPYHPHGKTSEAHFAYWEMFPSIDHVDPIARGGKDNEDNWVTTSMFKNMVKNHWSLDQLHWELHDPGKLSDWDGLTSCFLEIVAKDPKLKEDDYIRKWYNASEKAYKTLEAELERDGGQLPEN